MKKARLWVCAFALVLALCAGASAENMVSVAELYDQAQAMGGRWTQTFDTENGIVQIDAPIFVPDIEAMPVLTLEGAKISRELYEQVVAGKKPEKASKRAIKYELEMDGVRRQVFLGYETDELKGYDAISELSLRRGGYISPDDDRWEVAEPVTYHYPWMLDLDQPCLRGNALTVNEAMQLWTADIAMCYPGEEFVLQPKVIDACGSMLSDETGKSKAYKRDGYFKITAEQVVDGVPLFGGIINQYGDSPYAYSRHASYKKTSVQEAQWMYKKYGVGVSSVIGYAGLSGTYSRFADGENTSTTTVLARTRSVEIADVPLAPLDRVLAALEKEIKSGNIRRLESVRLGYVLYSNPEMTDHAWAIPRWVVNVLYKRDYDGSEKASPWVCHNEFLIDSQSGELIIFGTGDKATFSVPKMKTWDDVR